MPVLKELIRIQFSKCVFNKEEGVEIKSVLTLFLSSILSCLEIQVMGGLPCMMLQKTANMSLTVAAKLHSLIRFIAVLTPLPWHRHSLAGVCSWENRLDTDVSEYQILPAVGLPVDVGNVTSGKLDFS